jgi:hypothetical protein
MAGLEKFKKPEAAFHVKVKLSAADGHANALRITVPPSPGLLRIPKGGTPLALALRRAAQTNRENKMTQRISTVAATSSVTPKPMPRA